MKNYNKILEAVNRGIQLALDDFDDEEQVQNVKSKQIQNRDYTKEYLDLMNTVVDLGLPSGTLWCKYNLDVNPNQLSKAKDWYGKYYAWGETEPNKYNGYGYDTYKYSRFSYNDLTKYCPSKNSEYGYNNFSDDLTQLLPEDDAAYQNMHLYNFKFHIPTKEQSQELVKYTTNKPVENYKNIQGLNGIEFTSKINEQVLFIPFAGYYDNIGIQMVSREGCIWTSDVCLYPPYCAWRLSLNKQYQDRPIVNEYGSRCNGYSIRPVINL